MKIIPLKCFSCGAAVEFHEEKKFMFCPFCGSRMILDDESQRIEVSGKVEVSGIATLNRLCENAETFIGIGDFPNADRAIRQIYMNYPNDYRGYYLSLLMKSKVNPVHKVPTSVQSTYDISSFTKLCPQIMEICDLTEKALHFGPKNKQEQIKGVASLCLASFAPIIHDARKKADTYRNIESICDAQRSKISPKLDELNMKLAESEKRIKYTSSIVITSAIMLIVSIVLVTNGVTFLTIPGSIAMVALLLSSIYILYLTSYGRIIKHNHQKTQKDMARVYAINGQSGWPLNQSTPEFVDHVFARYSDCMDAL